jgi:Fur family peroxide stress response transcriptional regulator
MKSTLAPLDSRTKRRRMTEFRRLCRERGIPLTTQRCAVLKTVLALECHPTADDVYAAPAVREARISRATVYRTLESLARLGVITKACHPGSVVRYDARIAIHHHLICMRCDAVFDIADARLDAIPIPDTSALGFDVKDFRVQLRGLCRRCRRLEDKR